MKITVNLSKAELDLIEEALLQYQNLLLKSKDQDEMVNDELKLVRRVLEEFGMEDLEENSQDQPQSQQKALPMPPGGNQYQPPQGQYASPNQYHGPNTFVAPNQYPFSR
ncbi:MULTISPECIES: hypothetical protein [Thermoactinomyces]|jgi:hypothetical protein|uniref:Uncharacterized protein n=1 Tax=Thermoactinomyces vulgaris TaxID=2026 RepID=A0ABS0QGT8_THEVU|nr:MULTISPECIES: hypothetical protein [Thermoactinomyces]KYQ86744.1 hypothetical protein AYX07_06250 [Thermoactinomyces sp. AS95]MBA4550725.1 hypothetical protein [Thermoactinomyces vulgaris]MBA4596216.1 hypothetical protein [Thermoactinomyces vulgaris]MBH8585840.1 hypothetical protein [Thermoactinomyces sp. CICC 10520]MBH8588501.1 hypothetical protein [Thermoactinomyces vulgaris]